MKSRPYGSWTRTGRPRRPRYDRLLLVVAGVGLIAASVGLVFADVRRASESVPEASSGGGAATKSDAMRLTIPSMKRVRDVPVYGDPVKEEAALRNGTLHVKGTGFPWDREANVYIAGHRIGYPRTDSFLVFWDLNKLRNGRRVVLTDSEDTRYVYKVFDRFVVGPDETSVTKPVEGTNIVSLQTCTLPDYSDRLIVRAELVRTLARNRPGKSRSGEPTGVAVPSARPWEAPRSRRA